MNKILITLISVLCLTSPTKVRAFSTAGESEELTYDDLISQLSEKREQASRENRKAQEISVQNHLSLGIVNSFSQIHDQGRNYSTNMNGFEVATGLDLNSKSVRGEISFRNYFEKNTGTTDSSLREILGDFQYRRELDSFWRSKFMGGLAIRQLKFRDSGNQISVDNTSSMLMAGLGIEARLNPTVSFGGDLTTHLPFGATTSDRSSLDLGLKMDTSF